MRILAIAAGTALIVLGVGVVFWPAALVVAGVLIVAAGIASE